MTLLLLTLRPSAYLAGAKFAKRPSGPTVVAALAGLYAEAKNMGSSSENTQSIDDVVITRNLSYVTLCIIQPMGNS